MPEVIRLTLPRDHGRFVHVARMVIGGLGMRLDLSYESLDDLQLAVETVLAGEAYGSGEEVTLEFVIRERALEIFIAPLDTAAVAADLDLAEEEERIGLRRLLSAVVDAVSFEKREDETWLRLEKQVPLRTNGR